MATNYQRHSKGGRFRRSDIGDAGIRSFSEQQQNIIDSIKLQQQQDKEISADQISGFQTSTANKLENNRILDNLESKIFSNKLDNIKVRKDTDIKSLETLGQEYKNKESFWLNFSTTYAAKWGKAADSILEFKDRMWANKYQEAHESLYPNLIKFNADYFREGAYATMDQKLREALNKTIGTKKSDDPVIEAQREEARVDARTNLHMMNRTNRWADERKVAHFTENIDQIEQNLKETILNDIQEKGDESGLKWNSSTIAGHYQQAARNLVLEFGIRPNSKEAMELKALFTRRGTAAALKAGTREDAFKDKDLIETSILNIKAASSADKPAQVYKLVGAVKVSTIDIGDGKYQVGENNFEQARIQAATISANYYKDKDAFIRDFQNMHVANPKDKNGDPIAWNERYSNPKKIVADEEELSRIWTEANKWRIQDKTNNDKLEDQNNLTTVQDFLKDPKTDLSTKEGREQLTKFRNTLKGTKTQELLNEALSFDFENKNKVYLDAQIIKAWKDGRPDDFSKLYPYVDSKTKTKFDLLWKDMDDLVRADGYEDGTGVRKHAQQVISDIVGGEAIFNKNINRYQSAVVAYENAFYKKFRETEGDPNQKFNEARIHVDNLVESGKGVFRREGTGGKTRFMAFEDDQETEKLLTDADIDTSFENITNPKAAKGRVNTIIGNHQNGTKLIADQDDIDELLLEIDRGKTVAVPYTLQKLYNIAPGDSKSIEEFAGKVLDIDIPPGAFSLYEFIDRTKSDTMNIPDKEKYTVTENAMLNAVRMEFDEWPVPTAFGNIINSAGGLEFITDEDNYAALNDPQRDPLLYFTGSTIPYFMRP